MLAKRVMYNGVVWTVLQQRTEEYEFFDGEKVKIERYLLNSEEGARIEGQGYFIWVNDEDFIVLPSSNDFLETDWSMGLMRGLK